MTATEYVHARRALLDVLDALRSHSESLVLVGSQAIYLRAGNSTVGVPQYTTDADLAIDPDIIASRPDIALLMRAAGFHAEGQPGHWQNANQIAIDLMVPAGSIPEQEGRTARILGHDDQTARRTSGLELSIVSNSLMTISALDDLDPRSFELAVASFAALLVAKLTKIRERQWQPLRRQLPKDATDVLLILRQMDFDEVTAALGEARSGPSGELVVDAVDYLKSDLERPASHLASLATRGSASFEDPNVVDVSIRSLGLSLCNELA